MKSISSIIRMLLTISMFISYFWLPFCLPKAFAINPLNNTVSIRIVENLLEPTSTPSYSSEDYFSAINSVFTKNSNDADLNATKLKYLKRTNYQQVIKSFERIDELDEQDVKTFGQLLATMEVNSLLVKKLMHSGLHPDFIPVIYELNKLLQTKMASLIDDKNLSAEDIEVFWQKVLEADDYSANEVRDFLDHVSYFITNATDLIQRDSRQSQLAKLNQEESDALAHQRALINKETRFSNYQKGRLWKKLFFYTAALTVVYFGMDYYSIESHGAMEALAENSLEFVSLVVDKGILGAANLVDWMGMKIWKQEVVIFEGVKAIRDQTQSAFEAAKQNTAPYLVLGVTLAVVHQSISSFFKAIKFYSSEKWQRRSQLKGQLLDIKHKFRNKRQELSLNDESRKELEKQRYRAYAVSFFKLQQKLDSLYSCEKSLVKATE